ncbi:hypothetical protein AB0K12_12765 [Nonomuraea sp. NPDC049419]|uniref:hypothetical protein n=1 Tax=Nonomuraea sp. NPDC049419 TaxID=3155772 RepID=UPI00341383DA
MNTNIRQARASRRGRYAMLAVAAAASSVIFLPVAQGVASASAGFHTVQAGGPPAPAAPVRHVTKVRHVPREKPILHNPRYHMPRIRVIIHNRNHNKNRRHHEMRHHRHERVLPQQEVEPEGNEEEQPPIEEEIEENEPVRNDGRWWWPNELR